MVSEDIEQLITLLAKLPGLGPRSARRATLNLIKRKEELMKLKEHLSKVKSK